MVKLEFAKPTDDDLRYIADNMRDNDRIEVQCAGAESPHQALTSCVKMAKACVVARHYGVPLVMYGMSRVNPSTGTATIWMLGSKDSQKYPREFMVYTRRVLKEMLLEARQLTNYVHTRNSVSVNWLKALGFTLSEPVRMGPYSELFHRFTMERSSGGYDHL